MLRLIQEYTSDFYRLFYPNNCGGCNLPLAKGEQHLCIHCALSLPFTNFEMEKENAIEKIFYGRVPIEFATTLLYFYKGEITQHIMHNIKYNDYKTLAVYIGKIFGERLQNNLYLKNVDVIMPIPLHPKKQQLRGFNQSELFAESINQILKIDLQTQTIVRNLNTETQTKKNRIERWENVADAFILKNPNQLKDKHILLVDDILTTGATLEACAQSILKQCDCKISIATIAYAM